MYYCGIDDLSGADWWNWWGDDDVDDAAAALPDTPSTSSSLGCGSDGVPDSPLTLRPSSSINAFPHPAGVGDLPWSAAADKLFPAAAAAAAVELTNRQSSYVPRDLLLCMTSRTAVDADSSPFVH